MAQELTAKEFQDFQEFIYSRTGIRIPDTKCTLLSNRIRQRLRATAFTDFQSYYRHVISSSGRDEMEGFLNAVTTNETFFFRTEKHFDWFQNEFVTEMIQQQRRGERSKRIRVWSAACSSGAEPYSLAICLARNGLRLRDWTLEILGTDISEQMLQQAREGVYAERSLELLPDVQRRRYFKPVDDGRWRIQAAPRELVQFQFHNLMNPLPPPSFDCVFIRNVLIYFDHESKARVISHLVRAMSPGGYLVVGPSEGIYGMLGMLQKHSPFLYQKA